MDSHPTEEVVSGAYSFGQNAYGELCHGDTLDRSVPTSIAFCRNKSIRDVACGNEQTAFLLESGQIYSCGYNDSGQCGIGTTSRVGTPCLVSSLTDKRVIRIHSANGCEHLVAITSCGALYTFGFNSRGQLGHGNTTTVTLPTLVRELKKEHVFEAACSYFHTIATTLEGKLYAFGRNDFGQLGVGDGIDKLIPVPVPFFNTRSVLAVACGQHHTVVSLIHGGVYSFGKNDHGQLGIGHMTAMCNEPTLAAPPLDSSVVTSLSCGYYHTIALTQSGTVFSFGKNDYGQLGLGDKHHRSCPTLVESLVRIRIVQVTCGCYHTLTLSEEGKVHPFGRNNHGQLGLESLLDCASPQIITSLRDKYVYKVSAGFYHSICLFTNHHNVSQPKETLPTLSSSFKKLINNSCHSDITINVGGEQFFAHRCILAARCEPLEKMLDGRMVEGSLSEISIPEYSAKVFETFLEFIYTDQVCSLQESNLDEDFLLEVLAIADQYLAKKLRSICEAAILRIISKSNVVLLLQTAHLRDAFSLKKRCMAFIMDHFGDVIATEEFIDLPPTLLQEVLFVASRQGVVIKNQIE